MFHSLPQKEHHKAKLTSVSLTHVITCPLFPDRDDSKGQEKPGFVFSSKPASLPDERILSHTTSAVGVERLQLTSENELETFCPVRAQPSGECVPACPCTCASCLFLPLSLPYPGCWGLVSWLSPHWASARSPSFVNCLFSHSFNPFPSGIFFLFFKLHICLWFNLRSSMCCLTLSSCLSCLCLSFPCQ